VPFRYICLRFIGGLPVLLGITILVFLVANLAPGDPLLALMDPQAPVSADAVAVRREQLGLNKPMPIRYLVWLRELSHGNLGFSYASGRPITTEIGSRLPATLELMIAALLLALVLGVTLGTLAAVRRYSVLDYAVTTFSLGWVSVPGFFFGLVLIYVFSLKLRWLPGFGMTTAGRPFSLADNLQHLVMPATMLGLERAAIFARYTRSSMLDVLNREFITTARAKGLREATVIRRHGLRTALIPIITVIGLNLPILFGGAVIAETVFQWPGMGLLYIQSVGQRDYPLIMGLAFFSAAMVLLSNLLADICYAIADPRVKYE
jgi:peptide/nickel transport system permease protein